MTQSINSIAVNQSSRLLISYLLLQPWTPKPTIFNIVSLRLVISVTRLGDFLNFLVTNYLTKVAQILFYLFGLF